MRECAHGPNDAATRAAHDGTGKADTKPACDCGLSAWARASARTCRITRAWRSSWRSEDNLGAAQPGECRCSARIKLGPGRRSRRRFASCRPLGSDGCRGGRACDVRPQTLLPAHRARARYARGRQPAIFRRPGSAARPARARWCETGSRGRRPNGRRRRFRDADRGANRSRARAPSRARRPAPGALPKWRPPPEPMTGAGDRRGARGASTNRSGTRRRSSAENPGSASE